MNGHEGIGFVNLVDTGEVFMYVYSFFQLSVFFTLVFLFCWFFPLYTYISIYRNIGCILYIRPVWAEPKAVKSVWARGLSL